MIQLLLDAYRLSAAIRSRRQPQPTRRQSTAGRVSAALINVPLRSSLTDWTQLMYLGHVIIVDVSTSISSSSSSSSSGRRHRLLVTTLNAHSSVARRHRTLTSTCHPLISTTLTRCRYIMHNEIADVLSQGRVSCKTHLCGFYKAVVAC